MLRTLIFFLILGYCGQLGAQNFELTLIDDSIQSGPADPMMPIIFHFEATNTTDSTYLVDMIRTAVNIPSGWETALCTEACFPPEVSDAVFFLDEMATDEASFYFYPSSVGSGNATVKFINRVDTTNYYIQSVFVSTTPLSLDHFETKIESVQMTRTGNTLHVEHPFTANIGLSIFDLNGREVFFLNNYRNVIDIDLSSLSHGTYILSFHNEKGILFSY